MKSTAEAACKADLIPRLRTGVRFLALSQLELANHECRRREWHRTDLAALHFLPQLLCVSCEPVRHERLASRRQHGCKLFHPQRRDRSCGGLFLFRASGAHDSIPCLFREQLIRNDRLQSGPELRTGAATITATGSRVDGGWTSAGLFSFYPTPGGVWVTGSGPDEPDAVWNVNWEQATWVDHGAFADAKMLFVVYPVLPDKQLAYNFELVASSIEGSVSLPGAASFGGEFDGNYMHYDAVCGTFLTKQCRFARNAGDGSSGLGGLAIRPPPSGSLKPTMVFEGTEWTDNLAGSGPAIFVYYGQVDLRFRRCHFRCVTARPCRQYLLTSTA
eukprot:COSAG04_NODE_930_length_9363_cov_28.745898_2_plen_331_part_00